MKKSIYLMLAFALLMSSCGLYKKYERPDVMASGLYRDTATVDGRLAETDTVSLGSTPWREVFTDPLLQQLIDSAMKKNTDLRTTALSIEQAKAMLKVARLAFVPAINLAATGTLSSWDGGKPTKTYTLPVEASWMIDMFGMLNAKRAQAAVLLQSEDYQRAVRTGLISQIANMYYTLLMLDRQMEIVRNTEQLTKRTYEMMVAQKKYAGANESSVQSAKANYYSVMASIPELKRQIRETENALSLLLCEAPHQIPRGKLADQNLPETFSTGVSVQVLANRPDVHAKEMNLASCFYNVNKARAAFYPMLTISGTAAWTNSHGMIVNPGKILANAVGSLVQPIFQRGVLTAQLRVAKAQQEAAFLAWQQSVLNAGSEVSNALALYQTSSERIALVQTQVESLQRNVEVAEKLYKMDAGYNYLNVITAQQSLLQAQISQVTDQFYKMQAVVNLYYALGGGNK